MDNVGHSDCSDGMSPSQYPIQSIQCIAAGSCTSCKYLHRWNTPGIAMSIFLSDEPPRCYQAY
ncbi:hypothetical protein ACHAXS_013458 [Conticribra weissflogii]